MSTSTPHKTEEETINPVPKKAIPKGVVLGKDGKPCRSCTSFASWAATTKSQTSTSTPHPTPNTPTLPSTNPSLPPSPPPDCPPSVETLGFSSWTLLHSIAATYPPTPTASERANVTQFMTLFAKLYPCWVCAEDFQRWIARNGVKAGSREEFGRWLCEGHNEVNRKLGKGEFDCGRWEERWRTGWRDGRCD